MRKRDVSKRLEILHEDGWITLELWWPFHRVTLSLSPFVEAFRAGGFRMEPCRVSVDITASGCRYIWMDSIGPEVGAFMDYDQEREK